MSAWSFMDTKDQGHSLTLVQITQILYFWTSFPQYPLILTYPQHSGGQYRTSGLLVLLYRMIENTTLASFEAEMIDQATADSFGENTNISQQTVNVTDLVGDQQEHKTLVNASVIAISSISLTCCLIFLRIVTQCQRLPTPIKYLSKNFIVCFMMIDFTLWIHSIAMLCWGDIYYYLIFDSRIFFACLFLGVLWCSVAALTYERLIALVKPFKYIKYTTKTKLTLIIAFIWTVNVLVPTIVFLLSAVRFCSFDNIYNCDAYNLFRPFRTVFVCFMTIYGLFIIVSYIKILSIIFKHQTKIKAPFSNQNFKTTLGNNLRSTETVAAIISAFIILQLPVFIHSVIFELLPHLRQQQWRVILQILDYFGYQLNMYASLYLYVWKFKECKMQFYFLFSKCNKRFKQVANDMQIEVLDIVTIERK